MKDLLAVALLLSLSSVASCTTAPRRGVANAGAPATAAVAPNAADPRLVVVAAGHSCGESTDITSVTAAELEQMQLAGLRPTTLPPERQAIAQGLRALAEGGAFSHGLILYYTGHGTAEALATEAPPPAGKRAPEAESVLCLEGGEHWPVRALVGVLEEEHKKAASRLPWAVVVLDACESAFVDLSDLTLPVSLLAASPEPIAAYTTPRGEETIAPFARAFIDALRDPQNSDVNGDGLVTDRELLGAIHRALVRSGDLGPLRVRPRLQRQATSALPILVRGATPEALRAASVAAQKLAAMSGPSAATLAAAIDDQLALPIRAKLPRTPWDLVISRQPLKTVSCGGGDLEVRCVPGRADVRVLSPELFDLGAWLGQFSTALDVYEVVEVSGGRSWRDLVRVRDGRIMAVTTGEALGLVPRRVSVLAQSADDAVWLVRATEVIESQATSVAPIMTRTRRFTVCDEEEGQCFTASR